MANGDSGFVVGDSNKGKFVVGETKKPTFTIGETKIDQPDYTKRQVRPVDPLFMTASEEVALKTLRERYGKLGFTFRESRGSVFEDRVGNWITVISPDGESQNVIGFNYRKGSQGAKDAAEKLQSFLNRYTDFGDLEYMETTPEDELFWYDGLQLTVDEMFDKYKVKGIESIITRSMTPSYDYLINRENELKSIDQLTEQQDAELKKVSKSLDDFENWVMGEVGKKTVHGYKRYGITPATREIRQVSKGAVDQSEEELKPALQKDMNIGGVDYSSIEAFDRGFMHDAIEVRHRNYNDGERVYIELQRVWGDKTEDVNTLTDVFMSANPNVGLFADPELNRLHMGDARGRDKEKVKQYVDEGFTQFQAEELAAKSVTSGQKRSSVTNALFVTHDDDAARIRSEDRTTLEGTSWEIKRREVNRSKGEWFLDIYHKGVLVESIFDHSTSANYDYGDWGKADQYIAYDKASKYIYDNASDSEIDLMYLNQLNGSADLMKKVREKTATIKVSEKDAFDSYIQKHAVPRFKEDLKQNGVSEQTIKRIETYVMSHDPEYIWENKDELSGVDFIKDSRLGRYGSYYNMMFSSVAKEDIIALKVQKFENLAAIWDLIPEDDKPKILKTLKQRSGYTTEDGTVIKSVFEQGVEKARHELLIHKKKIWAEQVYENAGSEESELMRRTLDFKKIEAEKQANIINHYADQTFSNLTNQFNEKAEVLDGILTRAAKDGVVIKFTNGDITNGFEVESWNEDMSSKYFNELSILQKSIKELNAVADQSEKDIGVKISNWQNQNGDIYELNRIANIDYDTWWQDFGNSWLSMGLQVGALFGSDSAMNELQSLQNSKMLHGETKLTWQEAIETGQKAEYVGNTFAEQLPNVILAFVPIGGWAIRGLSVGGKFVAGSRAAVSKGVQRKLRNWSIPTIYGVTSSGAKRQQLEERKKAAINAEAALRDLQIAYDNKTITYDDYVENKILLERTIAAGDFSDTQMWGSILTTGFIEATITRHFGTAPNAQRILKRIYKPKTTDLANSLFRSNRQAIGNAAWRTTRGTVGEIFEETSIEVGTVLGDSLWLGDDMNWSNVDDVMVQSLIMGGGMNSFGNAYGTITQQMATADFRKEGLTKIEALKRIEKQLGSPDLSQTYRKELLSQYKTVINEFGDLKDGLEIDAMVVGADNIKTLVALNTELQILQQQAGVKPGDTESEIQEKITQYKKTLDTFEQNKFQGQIDAVNSAKQRIYDGIDYDGQITKIFGRPGEILDARWKDKSNMSKQAVQYRKADAKGKLKMILQQTRKNIINDKIRRVKGDDRMKQKVEEDIYSERDSEGNITKKMNFEQWKKSTGKNNRKKSLENAMYEFYGNTLLSRTVDAKMLFSESDVNAKAILGDKRASELKIKQAKNIQEIIEAVENSTLTNDKKSEILSDLVTGRANAVILDNNYIVLNEKKAKEKLDNGDLLQGTALYHEISHFIDGMAFTEKELINYATKLHSFVSKHKKLNHINSLAIKNLIEMGIWKGGEDATFEQQSYKAKDEYVREVQSLFQFNHNHVERDLLRKEIGQSLMNKLRGVIRGDFKIKTEKDAMYYMMAFLENVENGKISKVAKRRIAKRKGKIKDKPKSKLSTEASNRVQEVYNEKGEGGIMEILGEFAPIVSNIVNKYRDVPGFDRQLLIDEINTGKRGIYDLVRSYNPKSGVPLAAYINKFLSARSIEAANRVLKTEFELDVTDIGGRTPVDEETDVEVVKEKESLRKSLKIKKEDELYKTILSSVEKTFGTKLPEVTSSEFRSALENVFKAKLKTPIAKLMGGSKKYESFLNDFYSVIFDKVPIQVWVKIESDLPRDQRVFTEVEIENMNPTQTDKAISEGRVPKGTSRTAGNTLWRFKKPTKKQFVEFYTPPAINPKTGKRSGLKGTRKDRLAEIIGIEMAFDATMEIVQTPSVIERRRALNEHFQRNIVENEIALIAKKINRDKDYKFSRSVDANASDVMSDLFHAMRPEFLQAISNNGFTKQSIGYAYDLIYKSLGGVKDTNNKSLRQKIVDEYYSMLKPFATIQERYTSGNVDFINPKTGNKLTVEEYASMVDMADSNIEISNYFELDKSVVDYFANKNSLRQYKDFISSIVLKLKEEYNDDRKLIIDLIRIKAFIENGTSNPKRAMAYKNKSEFITQLLHKIDPTIKVDNRKGYFVIDKNGKEIKLDIPKEPKQGVTQDMVNNTMSAEDKKTRKKFADFHWNTLNRIIEIGVDLVKNKDYSKVELAMLSAGFLGNMKTSLRSSALFKYAVVNPFDKNINNYEYEHGIPAKVIMLHLLDNHWAGNKIDLNLLKEAYSVGAVHKDMNANLSKIFKQRMHFDYKLGDIPPKRWYNVFMGAGISHAVVDVYTNKTYGKKYADSWKRIKQTKDKLEVQFNKVLPKKLHSLTFEQKAKAINDFNKSVKLSRSVNPSKGITVLDFDDTLATTKSMIRFTKPDGTKGKLNAEQYARDYVDLLSQGYKFDFSEFSKVVKGKTAPLFNKALKLQDKFGPKNMFILTARPADSAKAIHEFVKANGLNIPIKNITGLANSTSEAKALWIAGKVAEGYNDFYFADDALQNVQAVKNMLDQFDVKSKIQQAKVKFSKSMDTKFNDILEDVSGMDSNKRLSDTQAKLRGASKGRFNFIIPPSAQDFSGLIYAFIGKGKKGEKQLEFFKKALFDPFARGVRELNSLKQSAWGDYSNLLKQYPGMKKRLRKKVGDTNFNIDQAVRVYLWDKAGFDVPGLSKRDLNSLVSFIKNDPDLQSFSDMLGAISKRDDGYSAPGEYWLIENIASDLFSDGAIGDVRSELLAEWIQNKNIIFSKENLNKIEALYGANFREALEDILYRMETGRNRPMGKNRLTNLYMNWVNNSVGAIMFFNMRSALLQTISTFNYINWSDNNFLKASAAFANQKQFWKDFVFIFNSDMLKQRRKGQQRGVNENELMSAVVGSSNPAKAAIAWLLNKGFLPTQIADSFAISTGGASFYRNRIKTYIKQGMSKAKAEEKAFLDFQELTETAQQSARPDLISQQQASPMGRLILAFANTPMQYARIINKSARDLVAGRGDAKTHVSKIIYYGAVQSFIFTALQQAIWALIGSDEEEEKVKGRWVRLFNGMVDNLLVGIGFGGRAISTVKNSIMEYLEQDAKGFRADHAYTLLSVLSFSPPIQSKLRKIYSAIQTEKFNEDLRKEMSLLNISNPVWSITGNIIEGVTNIPAGRLVQKANNLKQAADSNNEWWQRIALLSGWNTWDLGVVNVEVETLKKEIKETKKKEKEKKKEIKKQEKKSEQLLLEQQFESDQRKEYNKGEKNITCSAVSRDGTRCKVVINKKGKCTIHEKVKMREDGKQSQCKKIKSDGKRCKMKTKAQSGYCYYHD